MTYEALTQLLQEGYGWTPIESRNKYMYSYRREDTQERLNYYYSTGTFTIQGPHGSFEKWPGVFTFDDVETALISHNK